MKKLLKVASLTFVVAFLLNFLPLNIETNASEWVSSVNIFQEKMTAEETNGEVTFNSEDLFKASSFFGDEHIVRVQLRNYLGNQASVSIALNGSYSVAEDQDITLKADRNYTILVANGQLQLLEGSTNLKTFSSSFTLVPQYYDEDHYLFVNERAYLGKLEFTVQNNEFVRPINILPLEDYLKGVVPREMPALWNLEALKAQAVVARSYAMRRLNNLNDTTSNQVYGGYKLRNSLNQIENLWHPNSTAAVTATEGKVVLTGSAIAETVYSSSNGGYVESNNGAWGSPPLPYLVAKPDSFDPKRTWSFTVHQQQLIPGDLSSRDLWWETTAQQNPNITNRLSQSLAQLAPYQTADSFKINTINNITFSHLTDGQRYRNATFDVSFFVKDKEVNTIELEGRTRWDTNQVITQYGWPDEQDVVIIGRGDQSADALTGNVLATKHNAPMLLTKNNELPEQIASELTRLNPSKIYILGGHLAISEELQTEIEQLAPQADVSRIAGNNRYATSIKIANEIDSSSKSIILAPAYDPSGVKESPDALTIGPFAGNNQIPIILTERNILRNEIRNYIIENDIEKVYLLGGDLVVARRVETALKSLVPDVVRIAGQTRYETATMIADRFQLNNSRVYFSRGDDHIDALAAAPLATREQAPILLTRTTAVPPQVRTWLNNEKNLIDDVYFLGGHLAIDNGTRESIKNIIKYRYEIDGPLSLQEFHETITITTDQLRFVVGGSIMRSTLIDSNTASLESGIFTVSGRGFGHGVGMSQFGANARATEGHTYEQILEFYYPNTTIAIR